MRLKKIAFSGGATSGLMLKLQMENNPTLENCIVVFCNTGKEFNATIDFVHQVETQWGVKVIWLEYTRVPATAEIRDAYQHAKSKKTVQEQIDKGETTHWFKVTDYEHARRNGDQNLPFDELLSWANVLPNQLNRMCSVQMKVRTMMRYLFSIGVYEWNDFIGIRADEAHRVKEIERNATKYATPQFPLVEQGITLKDVTAFWNSQPFKLKLQPHEGNCDLCYLKKWWKLVKISRDYPGSTTWWEQKEAASKADGNGRYFRIGKPYSAVARAAAEPELLGMLDEIPCGCTTGAFTAEDIESCAQ